MENEVVEWQWEWKWRRVIVVAVGRARGRAQWVVKGQCQNVSKYFVALRLPRGPVQPSVKQSAPPFPSSVHSSVQLGENKWFNKRLEVCNHLNFTSFVLFMISVHNFLTVHPPPPHHLSLLVLFTFLVTKLQNQTKLF